MDIDTDVFRRKSESRPFALAWGLYARMSARRDALLQLASRPHGMVASQVPARPSQLVSPEADEQEDAEVRGPQPANIRVSEAHWLNTVDSLQDGIQQVLVEEVPDVQDGMTSTTPPAVPKLGGRTRWRRRVEQGVCIAADEGEGEARIVELDNKEDGLVASQNGIASLDV